MGGPKNGILVILGHKGSGKTQLARAFIEQQPRSVCIDTIGEYGGVIINDPESLANYLEQARNLPRFRVSYRDKGNHQFTMDQIFRMLHALRDCWLVLEEADKWFGPNRQNDAVKWFLKYGRHNRVSVLLVTRRAAEQGPMGTSQADTIVSFQMHEPRDLEWIASVGGRAVADEVDRLGQYEWTYVLDTSDEIRAGLDAISGGENENADNTMRDLPPNNSEQKQMLENEKPDLGTSSVHDETVSEKAPDPPKRKPGRPRKVLDPAKGTP